MSKKEIAKEDMYKSFVEKVKKLKKDEPFLATLTVFSKENVRGKELETFLFINNFPYEEIEGTKEEIIKLVGEAK